MSPKKTWVALLRAINLGPTNKVAMSDLRELLESLGYEDVRTHLQSGNALFTASESAARLEQQIESHVQKDLGVRSKVLVRTSRQLAACVDANPFAAKRVDPKELHVVFLSGKPPAEKIATVDRDQVSPDQFEPGDRVVYLRLPNGVQGMRLPNWEKTLGLTATTRTWKTVTRLRELSDAT